VNAEVFACSGDTIYDNLYFGGECMVAGIYTLVSKERLDDVLGTLHLYTELPVELIDGNGDVLRSYGERTRYCALLNQHLFAGTECRSVHLKAGQRSLDLGEAYDAAKKRRILEEGRLVCFLLVHAVFTPGQVQGFCLFFKVFLAPIIPENR